MIKQLSFLILLLSCLMACQKNASSSSKPAEAVPDFFSKPEMIESPAGGGSEEPNLFVGADGKLYLSWIVKDSLGNASLQYAVGSGDHWSEAEEIASGDDWFVNWADFPAMAVDVQGNKIASYLPKSSAGTYSYDVSMKAAVKKSDGWSDAQLLNEDGFDGEHGFVSLLPRPDSGFFACWLDGRQGAEKGPMSLRAAFLAADMRKSREDALDLRVCDCCQTTAAWTTQGPVVLYRDRSETEVRDISIVRLVEGQWTPPMTIFADNWQIRGCPVNGPKADALGNSLAVAWFSMPQDSPEVKCIFSLDGGKSFQEPFTISRNSPLGRVDIELLDEDHAALSWLDETKTGAAIMLARIHRKKGMLDIQKIADTDPGRKSGFPQMTLHENVLYFAWTDLSEMTQIKMAKMPL